VTTPVEAGSSSSTAPAPTGSGKKRRNRKKNKKKAGEATETGNMFEENDGWEDVEMAE
ncbi:hypothetical protein ElyMa_002356600, partial [Elysia marginata]